MSSLECVMVWLLFTKSDGELAMTPEQRQEEISKAYVHAICAACGFTVGTWSQDHGGIDTSIRSGSSVGQGHLAKPCIDVQLKATTQNKLKRERHLSWQLERAHYDKLRAASAAPHLLVVLLLPDLLEDSIEHTVDRLLIKKCAYWVRMTGMEDREQKNITVKLPLENLFSPEQLKTIMEKVSRGEAASL